MREPIAGSSHASGSHERSDQRVCVHALSVLLCNYKKGATIGLHINPEKAKSTKKAITNYLAFEHT